MLHFLPSRFSLHKRFLASIVLSIWLFSVLYVSLHKPSDSAVPGPPSKPQSWKEASALLPRDLMLEPLALSLDRIPRLIHQSWESASLPPHFLAWSRTWRQHHPDWKWVLWTDEDNLALVKKHFSWFLDTYERLPNKICRADAARSMYMLVYGGMYADLDFECLRPFEAMFHSYSTALAPSPPSNWNLSSLNSDAQTGIQHAFFGRMGSKPRFIHSVPNAWMASPPGHPFFLLLLRTAQRQMREYGQGTPEELTGPVALHKTIGVYRNKTSQDYLTEQDAILRLRAGLFGTRDALQHELHILPKEMIYPYSWDKDGKRQRMVCSAEAKGFDAAECKRRLGIEKKASYSITYWNHSWEGSAQLASWQNWDHWWWTSD